MSSCSGSTTLDATAREVIDAAAVIDLAIDPALIAEVTEYAPGGGTAHAAHQRACCTIRIVAFVFATSLPSRSSMTRRPCRRAHGGALASRSAGGAAGPDALGADRAPLQRADRVRDSFIRRRPRPIRPCSTETRRRPPILRGDRGMADLSIDDRVRLATKVGEWLSTGGSRRSRPDPHPAPGQPAHAGGSRRTRSPSAGVPPTGFRARRLRRIEPAIETSTIGISRRARWRCSRHRRRSSMCLSRCISPDQFGHRRRAARDRPRSNSGCGSHERRFFWTRRPVRVAADRLHPSRHHLSPSHGSTREQRSTGPRARSTSDT